MKLYRYVKLNEAYNKNNSKFIESGYENEGRNLVNLGFMSPSYDYLSSSSQGKIVKYFFPSGVDALSFAINEYQFDDKFSKLHFEYALLEIDLPDDVILPYLRTNFSNNAHYGEFHLPYDLLYKYLNKENDSNVQEILNGLKIGNTAIVRESLENLKTKVLNPNLNTFNADEIYPYLCFPIDEEYKIMMLSPALGINSWYNLCQKYLYDLTKKREFYNHKINSLIRNNGYNNDYLFFDAPIPKEEFQEFIKPYLEEENQSLKKVLTKEHFNFR